MTAKEHRARWKRWRHRFFPHCAWVGELADAHRCRYRRGHLRGHTCRYNCCYERRNRWLLVPIKVVLFFVLCAALGWGILFGLDKLISAISNARHFNSHILTPEPVHR